MSTVYLLYTDGGARGNPGPAAIGGVVRDPTGAVVDSFSEYIGHATNNQAEYQALITGLKRARARRIQLLRCCLDSELLVNQLNGVYKIKEPTLAELAEEVFELLSDFRKVTIVHIPRALNREADRLVNEALDRA